MRTADIIRAWGKILTGERPSLSIEITRECPLKCPGCYAYGPDHLGEGTTLRQVSDFKGQELIDRVLALVDRYKPLHLSIVGGDPLVRYREVEDLMPKLMARGIGVQIVTSAFRPMAKEWAEMPSLSIAVSIDGLQPEHDIRRTPATYERILKNIEGQRIIVHCTITSQMMRRPGYLEEFVAFWNPRPEIQKIWFSIFTPQIGEKAEEILTQEQRRQAVAELRELRKRYAKLDMPEKLISEFVNPPLSPDDCTFAQTTRTLSADLKTEIGPCQFGGKPDCSQCGCMASMGLAAISRHKLGGVVPVGALLKGSIRIGQMFTPKPIPKPEPAFRVIQ